MSANNYLLNAGIRHQIYVQRYAGGQVKDLVKYLDGAQKEIIERLDGIQDLTQTRSLTRKLDQIVDLQKDALEKLGGDLTKNASEFAEYEAEFAVKTLNAASTAEVTLPASEQLRSLVTQKPMQLAISGKQGSVIQSLTLNQAVTQFSTDKAAEVTRTIQRGMVDGATVQQLTGEIVRTTNKHKRQAEALVRTSVNHISSEARSAVNRANNDILKGEEYVSVLDGRTTLGCAALDGKILGFDEPPQTPRHWNCRSLRVPALDDRFQKEGLEGTRASMDGPVSAKRTYSGWLKDQPKEFRVQVLGKERAALFDAGKISLDDFVDANGNPVSLKQLRVLDGATKVRKKPKVISRVKSPRKSKIPDQKKKFAPAKTIKEAENYAVDNGLTRVADFGKLDIEVANQINESIFDVVEEFPAMKGKMSFIGSGQVHANILNKARRDYFTDAYKKLGYRDAQLEAVVKKDRRARNKKFNKNYYAMAQPVQSNPVFKKFYEGTDGIVVGEQWGSKNNIQKFKDALARDQATGFHPVGADTIRSTIDHEMGHQLDYLLDLSKNQKIKDIRKKAARASMQNSAKENIAEQLSGYANKNMAEFIAEAYAEYKNNPKPRPIAQELGDTIIEIYKTKFPNK